MATAQFCGGALSKTVTSRNRKWSMLKRATNSYSLEQSPEVCLVSACCNRKDHDGVSRSCHLSSFRRKSSPIAVTRRRKSSQNAVRGRLSSDCSVEPCDVEEESVLGQENDSAPPMVEIAEPSSLSTDESRPGSVKRELIALSLPAIASQALDPVAQLMETVFIGRLGSVELASAGVSISIFNIISKLFNMPLLSVAATFVAEDISNSSSDGNGETSNGKPYNGQAERKQLSSVSTALLLAVGIGIFEALALLLGSGFFLNLMGIPLDSPMHAPAQTFLSLRALGAPAVVLSLALQGVLRGFKDTKTPVFCIGVGNIVAVLMFPLLINYFQMGVAGAAIATVVSQYTGAFLMTWYLSKKAVLLPPKLRDLKFDVYLKSGGFLVGRTLAVLMTMTIGTSMAARQGPVAMAAHQICLQVWLAVSLLTDALAASGQALVASSLSKRDYTTVKEITDFILKLGIFTGVGLASILGASFGSLATFFTEDTEVLQIVKMGILFVSASQPFNALAFIFDGLHFGVSDFPYAACSMMLVGVISSLVLLYAPSVMGLRGVWLGLTLFMGLRVAAGYFRILSKNGPWWFLHRDSSGLQLGEWKKEKNH